MKGKRGTLKVKAFFTLVMLSYEEASSGQIRNDFW
jgi:hypothetical protein